MNLVSFVVQWNAARAPVITIWRYLVIIERFLVIIEFIFVIFFDFIQFSLVHFCQFNTFSWSWSLIPSSFWPILVFLWTLFIQLGGWGFPGDAREFKHPLWHNRIRQIQKWPRLKEKVPRLFVTKFLSFIIFINSSFSWRSFLISSSLELDLLKYLINFSFLFFLMNALLKTSSEQSTEQTNGFQLSVLMFKTHRLWSP